MRTLYLYILDTLADWEPGHVMADSAPEGTMKNPAPLRYYGCARAAIHD